MDIDCQRLKLPQEILRVICSHVSLHELSKLRFVSKDFSNAAATYFFKDISFKFEASSFQNLLNIACHSNLRRYVSKLTTIEVKPPRFEPNIHERERSLTSFSKPEIEKLEKLKNFYLLVNKFLVPQVPTFLNCMKNLKSLSLGQATGADVEFQYWHDARDFSQLVNPSTTFPSLESLEINDLYLNEQYFQEFLLNNVNSLRSLKLRNVKIEITKKDLESKEYLKSNSWIRMFYFFAQSLNLKEIKLGGNLLTSCSGHWSSDCYCEDGCKHCNSSSLMLTLQDFITHVEGSSFPLPHPDEDLSNVDMKECCFKTGFGNHTDTTDPVFYWHPKMERRGSIRLLEKEPFKPSTFKAFMSWTESESDSDSESDDDREEEEGEKEDGEEEKIPNRPENSSPRHSAFDYTVTQIRANRNLWIDEEKTSLLYTLLEGFTEEDE
ncbi:uncharacterized protein Bfra_007564sa [Botrytis fragariae]|uniref:F-box domain-containing protein n=1 Tax=Botrytis fragariae TaxID=1964551 RepID=A0A8H6EDP8_9HELO|nr:uncharacterized protein Bfra_007564sa [Botrytis fragariae]KAF5868366.1 hypothetical protein Bfra_007564sa [Botrytis fragariae]